MGNDIRPDPQVFLDALGTTEPAIFTAPGEGPIEVTVIVHSRAVAESWVGNLAVNELRPMLDLAVSIPRRDLVSGIPAGTTLDIYNTIWKIRNVIDDQDEDFLKVMVTP